MNDTLSNNDGYGHPVDKIQLDTLSKGDSIRMACVDGINRYFYINTPGKQPTGMLVDVIPNNIGYTANFRLLGEGVINHMQNSEYFVNSHNQEIPPKFGLVEIGCFPIFADVNESDDNTRGQRYNTGEGRTICELYVKKA